jgi:hypothetical protein
MRGRLGALVVALIALAAPRSSAASEPSEPLTFAIGFRGGQQPGLLTLDSAWRAVRLYEPRFPGVLDAPRPLAIAERLAVIALVDVPLGEIVGSFQHELFGHGARGRELGFATSSQFIVPRPYIWVLGETSAHASTSIPRLGAASLDVRAAVNAAGIEANYAHGTMIARRAFRAGAWQGRGDALVYIGNRLVYSPSFFRSSKPSGGALNAFTPVDPESGDDVALYASVLEQQARRRGVRSIDALARLRVAYLWNFFDPMLVSAFFATARFVVSGEERALLLAPQIGTTVVLPHPTFALTPFGPEHGVGVWLKRRELVAELDVRGGAFGGARYGSAASRIEVRATPAVTLAGWAELWNQPRLVFDAGPEGTARWGGAIGVASAWEFYAPFGVAASVGAKTSGYTEATPLGPGLYGWAGLRWRLPEATAP